ncbi:MAG: hypothetical protein ACOYMA_13895 [Bacteroidia bacterium]
MEKIKSNKACFELFNKIFEYKDSLYNQIAPNGWINSPYSNFLHPTSQQRLNEHIKIMSGPLGEIVNKKNKEKEKTLKDFKQDKLKNIDSEHEFLYAIGLACYDIFSNENEVVDSKQIIYNIGSHRGSASFIAEYINEHFVQEKPFDYIEFYLSPFIRERASLFEFYKFIFQTINLKKCNWVYFPYGNDLEMIQNLIDQNVLKISNNVKDKRKNVATVKADDFDINKLNDLLKAYIIVFGTTPKIVLA